MAKKKKKQTRKPVRKLSAPKRPTERKPPRRPRNRRGKVVYIRDCKWCDKTDNFLERRHRKKLTPHGKKQAKDILKKLQASKRYYLNKRKKEKRKTAHRQINIRILELQKWSHRLKKKMGVKVKERRPVPKKPKRGKDTEEIVVIIWQAADLLSEYLKKGFFKYYIIRGVKYDKSLASEIHGAFQRMEDDGAARSGDGKSYVIIVKYYKDKIVSFDIYE